MLRERVRLFPARLPSSLQLLDVRWSPLSSIEVDIPRGLRMLCIRHCKLERLPDTLGECQVLESVDLHDNQLEMLDGDEFPRSVVTINASYNALRRMQGTFPTIIRRVNIGFNRVERSTAIFENEHLEEHEEDGGVLPRARKMTRNTVYADSQGCTRARSSSQRTLRSRPLDLYGRRARGAANYTTRCGLFLATSRIFLRTEKSRFTTMNVTRTSERAWMTGADTKRCILTTPSRWMRC
jgi:hypothetical protein